MLRSYWQNIKDRIYDSVTSLFKSQADIDIDIENDLLNWGNVVYDPMDIPTGASVRKRVFWAPEDALRYVEDGGIPASVVTFEVRENADDKGNSAYIVWVEDDTP